MRFGYRATAGTFGQPNLLTERHAGVTFQTAKGERK
jgi:hypothetical protein